jgi:hypothetical protein
LSEALVEGVDKDDKDYYQHYRHYYTTVTSYYMTIISCLRLWWREMYYYCLPDKDDKDYY